MPHKDSKANCLSKSCVDCSKLIAPKASVPRIWRITVNIFAIFFSGSSAQFHVRHCCSGGEKGKGEEGECIRSLQKHAPFDSRYKVFSLKSCRLDSMTLCLVIPSSFCSMTVWASTKVISKLCVISISVARLQKQLKFQMSFSVAKCFLYYFHWINL